MGGGDATTAARLDSTPVKDTARARGAAAARRGECSIDFLRDAGESQMRRWIMSFQPNASSSDGVTLSEAPDDVWWWPPDVNADAPRRPSRGLLGCSQYSVSTLPSQSAQRHVSTVSRKYSVTEVHCNGTNGEAMHSRRNDAGQARQHEQHGPQNTSRASRMTRWCCGV